MNNSVKTGSLEMFTDAAYGNMSTVFDHYGRRVLFTEAAKSRMGQIVGYIVGMSHAGHDDFAGDLADSIDFQIRNLSNPDTKTKFTVAGSPVEVPSHKAILHDDGTFGGFGICWYRAINVDRYETELEKSLKDIQETPEMRIDGLKIEYFSAAELTKRRLKIVERVNPHDPYSDELSTYFFPGSASGTSKVFYTFSHNGGLIYHGPAAGQAFTMNLGKTLWGTHT